MEDVRKIKAVKAVAKTEFTPEFEWTDKTSGYKKYSFSDIAAMGTGWTAFASEFQKAVSASKGKSGLYYVNVPGTGQLFHRKNEKGYIGSVKTSGGTVGGGQATLTPIGVDPVTIAVAVALMNVEKKLGDIQEVQEEMKDFLEKREKSKQKGDLLFMADILNNLKYNWSNSEYKRSNHIKVLDIKQAAEQNIVFYRSLVEKHLNKSGLIQLGADVKRRIAKQVDLFNDYQLAVYLFAMASFLDVVLVDNYATDYIDAVVEKINEYSFDYRMLYSKAFEQLESEYKKSVSSLTLKGLQKTSEGAAVLADKVPGIKKTSIDDKLNSAGEKIETVESQWTTDVMHSLLPKQGGSVKPFIDNLESLNELYNQPVQVLCDDEYLYLDVG